MSSAIRIALICLGLAFGAFPTPVFAFDCQAESSSDGAYGYSYDYENQPDAEARALAECENNTGASGTCSIVQCSGGPSVSDSSGQWGCKAQSSADDAYGYSHSYDNRSDAEDRALSECEANTGESGSCSIVECGTDQ